MKQAKEKAVEWLKRLKDSYDNYRGMDLEDTDCKEIYIIIKEQQKEIDELKKEITLKELFDYFIIDREQYLDFSTEAKLKREK